MMQLSVPCHLGVAKLLLLVHVFYLLCLLVADLVLKFVLAS